MNIGDNLMLALSAYMVGVISPRPANMTIMLTSMQSGRRAGLVFALGVILSSATWGVIAAVGLGAALAASPLTQKALLHQLSFI